MKPTSIIFLIISLVLVILGFIVTGVAVRLGEADDIQLVIDTSAEEESRKFTYSYSADNIAKISLVLKNAEVNVIGGAETPYIELVNFPEGMYDFSSSNRVITVNDNIDFTSLSGIASIASNFNGLRGFVNHFKTSKLEKTVNIYLCQEYPVNVIDCKAVSGQVNIENCISFADYNITVDSGTVTVNNVDTTSSLNINIKEGSASIAGGNIAKLNATVEAGSLTVDAGIDQMKVNISTGDFICNYPGSLDSTSLKLFSNVGKITIDGVPQGGYKEITALSEKVIHVNVGVGDIDITSN